MYRSSAQYVLNSTLRYRELSVFPLFYHGTRTLSLCLHWIPALVLLVLSIIPRCQRRHATTASRSCVSASATSWLGVERPWSLSMVASDSESASKRRSRSSRGCKVVQGLGEAGKGCRGEGVISGSKGAGQGMSWWHSVTRFHFLSAYMQVKRGVSMPGPLKMPHLAVINRPC